LSQKVFYLVLEFKIPLFEAKPFIWCFVDGDGVINKLKKRSIITISFVAKVVKLTEEISDFLKGTGRDPRRYTL
jgi:hypothetical protein